LCENGTLNNGANNLVKKRAKKVHDASAQEQQRGLAFMKPHGDHELDEEELRALQELFDSHTDNTDRWYLLKFQLALLVAAYYAIALCFFPALIVGWLGLEEGTRALEWAFIFRVRGVFIALAAAIAIWSYVNDLHMRMIFGSAGVIAFINLGMDIPVFYRGKFAEPDLLFLLILSLRILIVVMLFSLYTNIDRIPGGRRSILANPFAQ